MANTLTEVTPKLLAQGLLALRQMSIMPLIVNRSYEALAGEKGSTIDVPIPSAVPAQDVVPAATPQSSVDISPTKVALEMSKWKEAPFALSDKEMMEVMDGTIPMQASEAVKSIANAIDSDILGNYKKLYGYVGTAGTTPFNSTSQTGDASDARKTLLKQLSPNGDLRIVMDPDAEGNALQLRQFTDASFGVGGDAILNGKITRRLGFDWFMDQNTVTHTAGTITTGLIAKASTAQALGDTTIVCTTAASTGACALLEGDIVTFAGHSQTYVLAEAATQASAASDVTLTITPGLQKALVGSEAVTRKATHVVNLAIHRDCFAFATRPLGGVPAGLGSVVQAAVDPISGLTLRLEVTREHKRTRWSYDALWGSMCTRRELGVRLAG